MNVVDNIDYIHHLLNEPKKLKFTYNNDRRDYIIFFIFLKRVEEFN